MGRDMSTKVFVSYCHAQGDWVWDRLVPVLHASGVTVSIDRERFTAGRGVVGQMNAEVDAADRILLVLSEDYLSSDYCWHEMERAVGRDPGFGTGLVVPAKRLACDTPDLLRGADPALYVSLVDDADAAQWDLLLRSCGGALGGRTPDWLSARDDVRRYLGRDESVNLIVHGEPSWVELISRIQTDLSEMRLAGNDLGVVDLESGAANSRPGLVSEILRACGAPTNVPGEPEDLVVLDRVLRGREMSRVGLIHFDMVQHRPNYEVNLFAALRNLMMTERKLVLLVQSRAPFEVLLPANHPISFVDVKTVELRGRP